MPKLIPKGLDSHLTPDKARAFLGLIRAGEWLETNLDRSLETRHGLSLRGFEVLLFLAEVGEEGALRMSDLNSWTPLSQSRVSRLVAELEEKGLVEREKSPDDGRGVTVTITAAGLAKFREARTTHLEDLNRLVFDRLDEEELRQLAASTAKLLSEPPPD